MRFLLIYFTGTYNTRFLTSKLKERLVSEGNEVDTVEINADAAVADTKGYDFIGLSYPIYGFNPPLPFLKYLKKLEFNKGQKYFIYKNSGETFHMNNASSRNVIRYMNKKGAVLWGEYHFVMPYNIHFEFDAEFIDQLIYEDKKLMEIMLFDLKCAGGSRLKTNLIYNIGAFFVSIQALGGPINSFMYTVDKEKCTRCGLCVKACPENNISIKDGRVKFSHKCDMCMRCSFYCPQKAIQIGFLKSWRVHDYYDLEKVWQKNRTDAKYIVDQKKGFYSCFVPYFKDIDERYDNIGKNKRLS
ncbi:MAG: EFR1 family ferrodoxin [Christensenellaceae bacterium]|nr:EFR1 family ferrodoxin [Christensenellaceae bacterium]